MILTESYVRKLADQVLAHVDAPADSALMLEGSIAEGFGNSGSDIDFLLVCQQEADMPTMPSIFFIDGRRVEIRTRTIRQVTEHLKAVAAFVGSTPRRIVRLDEHLLNRCQRFLRGHIVRNSQVIHGIRKHLALGDFATVMTHWWGSMPGSPPGTRYACSRWDRLKWRRCGPKQACCKLPRVSQLVLVRPIWNRSGFHCSYIGWMTTNGFAGIGK